MPWTESVYFWLVHSALVSLAVLLIGSGAVLLCRQPARRLRIIALTLAGCLVTSWLRVDPRLPAIGGRLVERGDGRAAGGFHALAREDNRRRGRR